MSDLREEIIQPEGRSDQNNPMNVDYGTVLRPEPLAKYNPFVEVEKKRLAKQKQKEEKEKEKEKEKQNEKKKETHKGKKKPEEKVSVVQKEEDEKEKKKETNNAKKKPGEKASGVQDKVQDDSSRIISSVVAELVSEKESEKGDKESETDKEIEKHSDKKSETDKVGVVTYKSKGKDPKKKVRDVVGKENPECKIPNEKRSLNELQGNKLRLHLKKPAAEEVKPKRKMDKSHDNPEDNPVLKKPKLKLQKESDLKKKRKTGDASGSDEDSDEKKKKKKDADSDENKKKKKDADSDEKKKKKKGDYSDEDTDEKKKKKDADSDEKKKKKKGDYSDEDADEKKQSKKLKGKAQMKVTKDDTSVDLSDGVMKQLLKNMLKSASVKEFVKDEDEEKPVISKVKPKKKEKKLTAEDIQHQEYLAKLPILQAKTAPTALHTAIHGIKHINLEKFLAEIGFSSLFKFGIDYIPSRLGRYVVKNFDEKSCCLNLEDEKSIEVTVSKVHDLYGIPVGGVPLLSLDARAVGDDFEAVWKRQFDKDFKKVRVNDIALKLIASKEVDFLFKINFLTLFTNTMGMCASQGEINLDVVRHVREDDITRIDWCEYIFHCLKSSKAPTTDSGKYTGPYTLLALLYLDGTNYEKLPVVRTRPAIKHWSSFLMAQRQDMELKDECFGESELYEESDVPETEGFVASGSSDSSYKKNLLNSLEEKLAFLSKERAVFEELLTTAAREFPGDLSVNELHQKYTHIFKQPVTIPGEDNDADDDAGNDRRLSGTLSGH